MESRPFQTPFSGLRVRTILSLLAVLVGLDARAGVYCPRLLGPAPETVAVADVAEFPKNWKAMVRRLQSVFETRSEGFKKRLRGGEPFVADVLVLGSGVHGSIAAANLYRQDPYRKYVVLSASGADGVVFNVGEMFRVNSAGGSANVFPGSVIQLGDVMTEKYSAAQLFSDLSTLNLASYEGEFVFGESAARIIERPSDAGPKQWPARYRVETEGGLAVFAEKLLLFPGFGRDRYPFKDADFVRLIREEEKKPLPRLQSGDALLARAYRRLEEGGDPLSVLPVDEVFVVGDGHGGNIAVEFLRGLAPAGAYGGEKPRPKRVVWIGQKAKNGADFKQRVRDEFNAPKWDRYDPLGDELDGGGIESVPARLVGGRRITSPEGGEAYELDLLLPDGTTTKRVAKAVVFSTGYESGLEPLLKTLGSEGLELRNVLGKIESETIQGETAIAKRVFTAGSAGERAHSIFVGGPAAVPLATPEEVAMSNTRNPVSIDVLGRRTQALAKYVAPPTGRASRLQPAAEGAGGFITQVAAPRIDYDNPSDFRSSAHESEVHLVRTCSRFSLPRELRVVFRWNDSRKSEPALSVEIYGLDTPSSKRFARAVGRNTHLLRSLAQAFQDDPKAAIRFDVVADDAGRARDTSFSKTP